jgi:hypothetical protein
MSVPTNPKPASKGSNGVIVNGEVRSRSSALDAQTPLPKRAVIKPLKSGGLDGVAAVRKVREK